jgi:hypothetical protein
VAAGVAGRIGGREKQSMSQPRQEGTWPSRGPGGGHTSPPGSPGSTWSQRRIVLGGQPQGRAPTGPRVREQDADRDRKASIDQRWGALLTGRGAILGMFVVFFLGILLASWLHWSPLAGAAFVLGCVAAAGRTKPRDLLSVVVSPPVLFFGALLVVKALTSTGNALVSIAEGTTLTLANVAPWLLAGVVMSLIIACFRGLPRCVSELRREARGDPPADRARPTGNTRPSGNARPRADSGETP